MRAFQTSANTYTGYTLNSRLYMEINVLVTDYTLRKNRVSK